MEKEKEKHIYTTRDIAEALGQTVNHIGQRRYRKELPEPDETLGKNLIWYPETIEPWLEEQKHLPVHKKPGPKKGSKREKKTEESKKVQD